jgi:excisionase family DNA binding protein
MSVIVTLTVEQAAQQLGISKEMVRKLIRTRELRASNVGSPSKPMYRVRQTELEKFLDDREVTGIEG